MSVSARKDSTATRLTTHASSATTPANPVPVLLIQIANRALHLERTLLLQTDDASARMVLSTMPRTPNALNVTRPAPPAPASSALSVSLAARRTSESSRNHLPRASVSRNTSTRQTPVLLLPHRCQQ